MRAAVRSYQQGVRDLVSSGRYDTRDDFTVVAQPFFEDTEIPRMVSNVYFVTKKLFHILEQMFYNKVKG